MMLSKVFNHVYLQILIKKKMFESAINTFTWTDHRKSGVAHSLSEQRWSFSFWIIFLTRAIFKESFTRNLVCGMEMLSGYLPWLAPTVISCKTEHAFITVSARLPYINERSDGRDAKCKIKKLKARMTSFHIPFSAEASICSILVWFALLP